MRSPIRPESHSSRVDDWRGGGRFSGRITATYVMAGAVAKKIIETIGIKVFAHTVEIGGITARSLAYEDVQKKALKDPFFPLIPRLMRF